MPYQNYADGLYLIKRKSAEKSVDHYGILDIGNRISHSQVDGINPVVIHKVDKGNRIDWFQDTGTWSFLGRIDDESAAISRLNTALKNPKYDLFGNNCEHFARYIAVGKHESTQVQAVAIVAGLAALALWAMAS